MEAFENKKQSAGNNFVQVAGSVPPSVNSSAVQLKDNRPQSVAQKKQLDALAKANHSEPVQKKKNNTGLPENLKSGIENLSGISMNDVTVHYNSPRPAQLQAHAYAQGTEIHIASGQEKHLPHEAWHIVQQKQGRVKPTMQMKGKVNVNDDKGLEKEADVMGAKAIQLNSENKASLNAGSSGNQIIIQRTEITDALAQSDHDWNSVHNEMGMVNNKYAAYEHKIKNMDGTVQERVGVAAAKGVEHWANNFQNKSLAYLAELQKVITRTGGDRVAALGTNIFTQPDIILHRHMDGSMGATSTHSGAFGSTDHIEMKRTEAGREGIMAITRDAYHQLVDRKNGEVRNYIAEVHAPSWNPDMKEHGKMQTWAQKWTDDHAIHLKTDAAFKFGRLIIRIYYGQSTVPITAQTSIPHGK